MYGKKKGRSGSNRIMLIHSNVSNQMMLIHSNVRKLFKKQHSNTLYCFANRRILDESSSSMDEKFFLKKIEVTSICVFKKSEIYMYTRRLESNGTVTFKISCRQDIFKMNMSWCLLECFCELFRYFEQFPSDFLTFIFYIFDMN